MTDALKSPSLISDRPGIRAMTLALAVHWDGFRRDPRAWLQGAWWRLTGKKLRAHNRFSALIGQSGHAYGLWMIKSEPAWKENLPLKMPKNAPAILVVIDANSDDAGLRETIASVRASDPLANIIKSGEQAVANGWVLPIRAGDLLARQALPAYAEAASIHSESAAIYADDDLISADGGRVDPHFKPAWNAELYRHHDYISHAGILRFSGPLPNGRDWSSEVASQALVSGAAPVRLPYVLHHRRARQGPRLPGSIDAKADQVWPHVTVIVPTRDRLDLLRTCVEGLQLTDYPTFDCIVIDNESSDPATLSYLSSLPRERFRVIQYRGGFNFSAMNNAAAQIAEGKFLCFLNNDIEILNANWMRTLVAAAMQENCGAAGAKLLYSDGTIQHAGVVIGVGGGAGHAHRLLPDGDAGYFQRAHLPQQVSAVTAACMIVAKDKFKSVGGFDTVNFPVAFNDVDLCLKLNARGWQCFYEPRAVLIHHESKSRGKDSDLSNRERFAGELAALKRIWKTDISRDPFHHPQLSPFCDSFVVAI